MDNKAPENYEVPDGMEMVSLDDGFLVFYIDDVEVTFGDAVAEFKDGTAPQVDRVTVLKVTGYPTNEVMAPLQDPVTIYLPLSPNAMHSLKMGLAMVMLEELNEHLIGGEDNE